LLEVLDIIIDALASLQLLLTLNNKVDTIDQHVDQFNFTKAQSVGVRDIKDTANSLAINTTSASLLKSHLFEDGKEVLAAAHVWDFDVDTASDTGTQVGWASENVSEVLVPHEIVAASLDGRLKLVQTVAESCEDLLHVAVLLHGNNSDVVLFVDPDEEVFGSVVPDTSGIGPVTGHTGAGEKWRDWLVKEKVVVDELVLFGLGHLAKGVVLSGELTAKVGETVDDDFLDLSSLSSAAPWGQRVAADGSSGSASRRNNVVHVELVANNLCWVEASLVLVAWLVAVVSVFDDWVEELLEGFVRLFVTGNGADGHDKWMAGVVDTGLDSIIDGVARWGLSSSHFLVEFLGEHLGHVVVVLAEVGEFLVGGVVSFVKSHGRDVKRAFLASGNYST